MEKLSFEALQVTKFFFLLQSGMIAWSEVKCSAAFEGQCQILMVTITAFILALPPNIMHKEILVKKARRRLIKLQKYKHLQFFK